MKKVFFPIRLIGIAELPDAGGTKVGLGKGAGADHVDACAADRCRHVVGGDHQAIR
ncbi:hypothetical protein ACWEPN_39955 [Nonomuraea wenchangensis]